MKKVYIVPAIVVVELEAATMLASSINTEGLGNGSSSPSFGGDSEGGMSGDANRHRGSWGNLWT